MTGPALADPQRQPDDAGLAATLGPAKAPWDALLAHLDAEHPDLARAWKFYGAKYGWHFRVSDRKRAVLWLIPGRGRFTAALALGEAAAAAAQQARLPRSLIAAIAAAPVQREGRAARVEVTTPAQVRHVTTLLALKRAG